MVISNSWDKSLIDSIDINSIGNIMYTSFSIWLILISLILLLAMIGSIIITIKQ
jgi:NADH-ubiquinone oxidoreductase chain 6